MCLKCLKCVSEVSQECLEVSRECPECLRVSQRCLLESRYVSVSLGCVNAADTVTQTHEAGGFTAVLKAPTAVPI